MTANGDDRAGSAPSDDDAELAAIRARLRAEILQDKRQAARPPPPDPTPVELDELTFPSFLAENPRAVVDVWAPWCGPCRTTTPILEQLARELAPAVKFGKLNADNEPTLAAQYGVQAIPTLLMFGRGRLVDQLTGAYPIEFLRSRFQAVYGVGGGSGRGRS